MAKGMKELLNEARARIREISPQVAAEEIEAGPDTLILDVREPTEFAEGHIPGALLIPRGLLEPRAAADSPALADALADRRRPILAYCGSGVRSALAAATLQELGFANVYSMAGGFDAWLKQGRPVEA